MPDFRSAVQTYIRCGDGADLVARPHLPAELADGVDDSSGAVLGELVPYGFVDLSLSEHPAGPLGQKVFELPSKYCLTFWEHFKKDASRSLECTCKS